MKFIFLDFSIYLEDNISPSFIKLLQNHKWSNLISDSCD